MPCCADCAASSVRARFRARALFRAADFAASALPSRVHEALIKKTHKDRLVSHIARDATAIAAREKPVRAVPAGPAAPKRKRGRPKKGEVVAKPAPRRLERQASMTLAPSAMPRATRRVGSATICTSTPPTATYQSHAC